MAQRIRGPRLSDLLRCTTDSTRVDAPVLSTHVEESHSSSSRCHCNCPGQHMRPRRHHVHECSRGRNHRNLPHSRCGKCLDLFHHHGLQDLSRWHCRLQPGLRGDRHFLECVNWQPQDHRKGLGLIRRDRELERDHHSLWKHHHSPFDELFPHNSFQRHHRNPH